MRQLFFDDEKLFVRENVKHSMGKAELIPDAVYRDGLFSTPLCAGTVFKIDGKYRMLYQAIDSKEHVHLFSAESQDGVHFTPEDVSNAVNLENRIAPHEIMPLKDGFEIGDIYEDITATDDERYKLFMSEYDPARHYVDDKIYSSKDLLHWNVIEGARWGRGAEPIMGSFYNSHKKCHTFLIRPFWGVRTVGYVETTDWKNITEFSPCMQKDCLDEPLSEIYGMKAFGYAGMYIGFPQVYNKLKNAYSAKFFLGCEEIQLAYSFDGRYWLRPSREAFISGSNKEDIDIIGYENKMIFISQAVEAENGDVLLFTASSDKEHGLGFGFDVKSAIQIYRVRKDGFMYLETENKDKASLVATREKIWNGGDVHINIAAQSATVAIYEAKEPPVNMGENVIGVAEPVEGFTHDDCVAFAGDSTDWTPKFKNGKTLDEFTGRTIVIEVKFTDGKLYSIGGDYVDVYNTEASRYRILGLMPGEEN